MQKLSAYSLLLTLSLVTFSLQSSTVWIFNRTTISGCIDDEIDKRIKPGKQNAATKVKLDKFKKKKINQYVAEVEKEHHKCPFKTEQEAKEYARKLSKLVSNEFFNKLVKKRINKKMSSLPTNILVFRDQFVTVARTYVENKAYKESSDTDCLNETLKNIDGLIDESLKNNFNWVRDLYRWLYQR